MIAAAVILYAMASFCLFISIGIIKAGYIEGTSGEKDAGVSALVGILLGLIFALAAAAFCVFASMVWKL